MAKYKAFPLNHRAKPWMRKSIGSGEITTGNDHMASREVQWSQEIAVGWKILVPVPAQHSSASRHTHSCFSMAENQIERAEKGPGISSRTWPETANKTTEPGERSKAYQVGSVPLDWEGVQQTRGQEWTKGKQRTWPFCWVTEERKAMKAVEENQTKPAG